MNKWLSLIGLALFASWVIGTSQIDAESKGKLMNIQLSSDLANGVFDLNGMTYNALHDSLDLEHAQKSLNIHQLLEGSETRKLYAKYLSILKHASSYARHAADFDAQPFGLGSGDEMDRYFYYLRALETYDAAWYFLLAHPGEFPPDYQWDTEPSN